jgi:hypothetical protein
VSAGKKEEDNIAQRERKERKKKSQEMEREWERAYKERVSTMEYITVRSNHLQSSLVSATPQKRERKGN